jgi:hypothetical protein
MHLADQSDCLVYAPAGKILVEEFTKEEFNGSSLLLFDSGTFRWVDIIHGVLDQHTLLLANHLGALLAL